MESTLDLQTSRESTNERSLRLHEMGRLRIGGKFFYSGARKQYIRGVTYGPFEPNAEGSEYHTPARVEQDFRQMAANGINAVRVYTVPPTWLLDLAQEFGIYVMVGLAWEQHISFLDDPKRARAIEQKVREGVRACQRHPAIFAYAIGNEIPHSIVRWYGRKAIEKFLKRLFKAVKAEDPGGLVTYINYPTTEYLQLPFLDFVCFNVYLESRERFESYLARLQNIAGEKPLLMAEMGLDSRRNGEDAQARSLDWQIRSAFAEGCSGVFIFSWTDEWHRGGFNIDDWDFGLISRDRRPKLALDAVREAFADTPFPRDLNWPKISVVVCSYNGGRTIRDCCEGLKNIQYPNFEVIVIDDGSKDMTASIARQFHFRVISTPNRGLSNARNTGMEAATGEIVAYCDDDARPDPHWLHYLAWTFTHTDYAGVGGPNIAPKGDGPIADCVANAPGGPVHVLFDDREAEHIPGCNMAFRKSALQAVGGFDPQYRQAGDDVDLCWRIQLNGGVIGFNHAAMVWHHRRNSFKMYWKQQKGYGKAEALLEAKWPHKYNVIGHLFWAGRIYGNGLTAPLGMMRWRVYHGVWGSALFQPMYQKTPSTLLSVPLMPEWYFIVGALAVLTAVGIFWKPLLWLFPLFVAVVTATGVQAALSARKAAFKSDTPTKTKRIKLYALTAVMHLLQPLARLWGRIAHGLTPWRRVRTQGMALPAPRGFSLWFENWQSPLDRLAAIESQIQNERMIVLRGGDYDRWDLEILSGMFGGMRLFLGVEEHGAGKQLIRVRIWPKGSPVNLMLIAGLAALSLLAAADGATIAFFVLATGAGLLAQRMFLECADAAAVVRAVLQRYSKEQNPPPPAA